MKKPGNAGGAKARQEGGCVESMTKQEELSKVEETPKQGREAESQKWSWVEAEVWTERMLTTLETGVKGGKWFSLIDKVYRNRSLEAAWRKVRRRKGAGGVDGQSIQKFEWRLERELEQLHQELKDDRYQPRAVRRHWIDKGGGKKRPLGIPTVRDRVVQTSLRQVLEPIFEKKFCRHSYGFRPQRSCKDALREVQRRLEEGYHWVVDADIEKYFDCIDPEILMPGEGSLRRSSAEADSKLSGTRSSGWDEEVEAGERNSSRCGDQLRCWLICIYIQWMKRWSVPGK